MATQPENEHENAESRRQERREEANKDYREQGDDMRQGGPDPDLPHRMRSRPGDGNYDPNVQADDQTSDGVAAHIGSSGQSATKRAGEHIDDGNKAPDRLDERNVGGGDIKD
jgi:cobalamin biosynthesis protein CobT